MRTDRIKVGREPNTGNGVFLMRSGQLICGGYTYNGRMIKEFRGLFETVWDMIDRSEVVDELDISQYRYWNALNIYDELIVPKWEESLSAKALHDLSIETQIHLMMKPVKSEFMRAISSAWKRAVKKSAPEDPNRPTQAWHLCRQ